MATVRTNTVLGIDVGRKNLALCLIEPGADRSGVEDKIVRWVVLSVDPTPTGLAKGLQHITDWPVSEAAIERQPAKNPTMKRLEHYLEMYFALKGVPATTIDAKHKLTFAAQTPWWPIRSIDSWTYNERKKLSVETVAAMLAATTQDPSMNDTFGSSKKKDDLADACLHAMAFAHNLRGRLPDAPAPVRRIKPTKPTEQHVVSGKYTQSGLKYLCKTLLGSRDAFASGAGNIRGFEASCVRHFGSLDNAYVQLGGK